MKSGVWLLLVLAFFHQEPAGSRDFLMGKFDYRTHPAFTLVPAVYTNKDVYLQKETLAAFTKMAAAATSDGISLIILSGTRNFNEQTAIWNRKWALASGSDLDKARKILEFSSMPGTSRHHWGTEIDLNSLNPAYFDTPQGQKLYTWLQTRAPEFGFCQTYDNTYSRKGYKEEKWHWSYLPLAKTYLQQHLKTITPAELTGFHGNYVAADLPVSEYIQGINPSCN